jgi:hypothetical protein
VNQVVYPIIEVPADAAEVIEAMGTKRKFWFHREDGMWLFKLTRTDTGEDWAEKIAEELCLLLGLPHAHYDLALWIGKPGVISPSFVGAKERLVPGNELLFELDPGYPKQAAGARTRVPQHTLDAIAAVLNDRAIRLPTGGALPAEARTAWDLFAGYLLLDAWIGNTDRHHENWALIESAADGTAERRLAPTHDHGSSLGRNEPDWKRRRRLETSDRNDTVEAYTARAASKLYHHPGDTKPLSCFGAFEHAAHMTPFAGRAWLRRLLELDPAVVDALFERIPPERISATAALFAQQILWFNRIRLLKLLEET